VEAVLFGARWILGIFSLVLASVVVSTPPTFAQSQPPSDPLAVVFLLDRSGSMSSNDSPFYAYVASNVMLDYAELLNPSSRVGVIEFSSKLEFTTQNTLVPLAQARRPLSVRQAETPDGETALAAAMQAGLDLVNTSGSSRKMVVILTDGAPTDNDPERIEATILPQYERAGVSIAAIGLGAADQQTLQTLADRTGGAFRYTQNASGLPRQMLEVVSDRSERLNNTVLW
jgi:Ca-activated chloride channel homolog